MITPKQYVKISRKIFSLTQLIIDCATPDVVSVTFVRKKNKHTPIPRHAHKKRA
jgi:hypothetical protein